MKNQENSNFFQVWNISDLQVHGLEQISLWKKKKVIWIGWYIHKKNKFLRNKLKLEKNEQK